MSLSVADEGPGIPPEARERVLDPFYRLDAARTPGTTAPAGVGLGLTFARRVAEVHGGAITVAAARRDARLPGDHRASGRRRPAVASGPMADDLLEVARGGDRALAGRGGDLDARARRRRLRLRRHPPGAGAAGEPGRALRVPARADAAGDDQWRHGHARVVRRPPRCRRRGARTRRACGPRSGSIEALIARETARGVPASRLVLAGFSQGGAMALHTGLRHAARLAGVMALSCFLPLADRLGAEASPANRDVPIFLAHGTHDPVIPLARARRGPRGADRARLPGRVARVPHAALRVRRGDPRHRGAGWRGSWLDDRANRSLDAVARGTAQSIDHED